MPLRQYDRKQLLKITADDVEWPLTDPEVVHLFSAFEAYWCHNYEAAELGRLGFHAILPSGFHGDGFFLSEPVLKHPNLRRLMASQLAMKYKSLCRMRPTRVIGVPNGATGLGIELAAEMEVDFGELVKTGDSFALKNPLRRGEILLLAEDFCHGATNLEEGMKVCLATQPDVVFTQYQMVILNCGGRSTVCVNGKHCGLASLATPRTNKWRKANCTLCHKGSVPLDPKENKENWKKLLTGQLH
jgi:hypothetical protein